MSLLVAFLAIMGVMVGVLVLLGLGHVVYVLVKEAASQWRSWGKGYFTKGR